MRASLTLRNSFATLQTSLPARRWSPLVEPLDTTSAHRLSKSIAAFLPDSWIPSVSALPSKSSTLPPGYHLVYFNPVLGSDDLLPDGTDRKHSPGEPFVRRMWAGGSVRFREPGHGITLDGGAGVCLERIRDVVIKGKDGQEKVFVGIERRIGRATTNSNGKLVESENQIAERLWSAKEDSFADAEIIERRNIVFMRERSREEMQEALRLVDAPRNANVKKSSQAPTVSHSLKPTASLLFRYSALTMNAHSIHLDLNYCRNVEGHRDLLVHGPMTCTLLMTMLNAHVTEQGKAISKFDYRNVAPLYANEELKLCLAEGLDGIGYRLWAENGRGEIAVKAEAEVVNKKPKAKLLDFST